MAERPAVGKREVRSDVKKLYRREKWLVLSYNFYPLKKDNRFISRKMAQNNFICLWSLTQGCLNFITVLVFDSWPAHQSRANPGVLRVFIVPPKRLLLLVIQRK